MTESEDILNFNRLELAGKLKERFGLEPFRARQLIPWVYRSRMRNFDSMTDIARLVREDLAGYFYISRPTPVRIQISKDGTRKYLFELADGERVESVLIRQPKRYTLCVSSQVGCAIGCKFCRTALMGLKRNLSTAEIVGQVLAVKDDIAKLKSSIETASQVEDFENIVFMGMGEPLHNYQNVVRAVSLLNDELGLNFSGRKITLSTSGLVPAIAKFGNSIAKANLAVSLNATTNEVRDKLIPINKRFPIEVLIKTLEEYPLKPGRRITLEYVMLAGVNDTEADLKRLPQLISGLKAKINLIPYNANSGLGFKPPSREVIFGWQETLLSKKINATVRWSKGEDIDAACGQLATKEVPTLEGGDALGSGISGEI